MSVRLGVIGFGYWGPNIVRNFLRTPNCTVSHVSDLRPERLKIVRDLYPAVKAVSDANEILNDPTVDAVAIMTPVSSHYSLAKAALMAGKNVMLAKPMTSKLTEAKELNELAVKKNLRLMIDHTFVFSGPVKKIRDLIDSGEIGDVNYYDSVRVNLGLFQSDVNVLWDLAPHDFSILLYLLDKKPTGVSAIGTHPVKQGGYKHESITYATILYDDKTIAHFHLNWLSPVKIRRTLIGGTKKMIVYDHLDPDNQVKVYDMGVDIKTMEEEYQILVQYRKGDMHAPKVDQKEALEIECQHFIQCIMNGTQPLSDGKSGLQVTALLEAAQESIKKRGALVTFDPSVFG